MSFRCATCKKAQPAGAKMEKLVTGKRDKTYETVRKGDRNRGTTTEISKGWETVSEIGVCSGCFKEATGQEGRKPEVTVVPVEKIVKPRFTERSSRENFRPQKQQVRKVPVVEVANRLKK